MDVLVIGGTGDVGGRVMRALAAEPGVHVRALARSDEAAASLQAVDGVEVVRGDLGSSDSLDRAFAGIRRAFLTSTPTRDQSTLEHNAIDAAERAGVERIVKVSNLPIAGLDDGLHGGHRAAEGRLARSPVAATVLQPSFFASVILRQADLIRGGRFVLPTGDGRIAWVDPDDIADIAVAALQRDGGALGGGADETVRVTGPESLSGAEVAARIVTVTQRPVRHVDPPLDEWRTRVVDAGMDAWLADSTVALYAAVARGALDFVSDEVESVLGRPPQSVDAFLRVHLDVA